MKSPPQSIQIGLYVVIIWSDFMKNTNSEVSLLNNRVTKTALKYIVITASVLIVIFIATAYLIAFIKLIKIPMLPTSQSNTKWESEDKNMFFCINESSPNTGTAIINGETVEFVLRGGLSEGGIICIYSTAILEDELLSDQLYEVWDVSVISKKKFVATITETKFSSDRLGQKITFYRK